jgi:glycosyltransferase involved in cell wall biosynthesis
VKVLIFHGYLLRGTGSNVYNASLAAALARLGHEVHLLCQERNPPAFPDGPGSVTVHRPDIGGLLPVFVHDRYAGFEVKTFAELTDAELERYIEANVEAVRDLVGAVGAFDAALANHLVMGPVILARAGLRYALKVHGSDLSYTVLPELDRFGRYAAEAVDSANGILVGSGHIAARLRQAVDRPDVNAKVRLGPPGVDVGLFVPVAPELRSGRLRDLEARLRAVREAAGRSRPKFEPVSPTVGPRSAKLGSAWDRDLDRAADAVEWFADAPGPRVVFVGKLIVSKGVDLLLAAWPLVHREHPGARLLIIGFGALEQALRDAWEGLERGDLAPLLAVAEQGRALEGSQPAKALPLLTAFINGLTHDYAGDARDAAGSVAFAGRLEHDEVGALVPACDSLVFPSTFPEAFGMVAAEAAAAAVLPISAAHSGAIEVSRELAAALPPSVRDLVSFPLDEGAIEGIAERLNRWLDLPGPERDEAGRALRGTVERIWSWEGVANGVIAASVGELERLPEPALDAE